MYWISFICRILLSATSPARGSRVYGPSVSVQGNGCWSTGIGFCLVGNEQWAMGSGHQVLGIGHWLLAYWYLEGTANWKSRERFSVIPTHLTFFFFYFFLQSLNSLDPVPLFVFFKHLTNLACLPPIFNRLDPVPLFVLFVHFTDLTQPCSTICFWHILCSYQTDNL